VIPPEARQEIEAVLSTFRQWLLESEQWRQIVSIPREGPEPDDATVGLHTLVGEWIALRQEFHLASRGNKATREQLDQAVGAFQIGLGHMGDEVRKLVDSLVRDRDRLRDQLQGQLESQRKEWVELLLDTRDLVARGVEASRSASRRIGWRGWFLPRAVFASLLEGHDLALRRMDAALASRGIHPIECEGRAVDPERMRVIDVARGSALPPGQIIEVLRNGYMRDGQVIRFAEVRVAGGPITPDNASGPAPRALSPRIEEEED